jgi:alkanesulfonate monooxygenase SsuD/methylene tetrahydromethanopterin reductase-like flavin-dependent oxidoreductase (luciferase family)
LGFEERGFGETLSDRVVDAIVAWGSAERIRERIDAHYRAGATHVCIMALRPEGGLIPDHRTLEAMAPGR